MPSSDVVAGASDRARWEREMRAAQRRAEQEWRRQAQKAEREINREIDKANRENQRRVDAHDRKVEAENKRRQDAYNREVDRVNRENQRRVDAHHERVDRHNKAVIDDLNRQLRAAASGPRYTVAEEGLADRFSRPSRSRPRRKWTPFIARIDGAEAGRELLQELESLDVSVWFDEVAIVPEEPGAPDGSGSPAGHAGIAVLTPAYLAGRFWTERELGAPRQGHPDPRAPRSHVRGGQGVQRDLAGPRRFETSRDSIPVIAQKIAAAVLVPD